MLDRLKLLQTMCMNKSDKDSFENCEGSFYYARQVLKLNIQTIHFDDETKLVFVRSGRIVHSQKKSFERLEHWMYCFLKIASHGIRIEDETSCEGRECISLRGNKYCNVQLFDRFVAQIVNNNKPILIDHTIRRKLVHGDYYAMFWFNCLDYVLPECLR